jgi:hypothetical protein
VEEKHLLAIGYSVNRDRVEEEVEEEEQEHSRERDGSYSDPLRALRTKEKRWEKAKKIERDRLEEEQKEEQEET